MSGIRLLILLLLAVGFATAVTLVFKFLRRITAFLSAWMSYFTV